MISDILMTLPAIVHWNPDPVLFSIGNFGIRWYSIFWIAAIICASLTIHKLYRAKGFSEKDFNSLFVYSLIGIFVGARLAHCFIYDWSEYYSEHILEIFLPVRIYPDGHWQFTGYAGLASHGGVAGLILAILAFCRRHRQIPVMTLMDIFGIAAPVAAGFIRISNLMNSEIIGIPSDLPWAFVFERVDAIPRHPAQLYEAIAYFVIFGAMLLIFNKRKDIGGGLYFGLCLSLIFTFRFFVEFIKEDQSAFESAMLLNLGQLLSIPIVALGAFFAIRCLIKSKKRG